MRNMCIGVRECMIPLLLFCLGSRARIVVCSCIGEAPNGFVHLCDSHMGGGQGNALTGQLFVIDLDGALKKTEAEFTGVELKAIQDDITIFAPPDVAWATLEFLHHELEGNLRLKINTSKCKCYGTTPDACAGKPDWLEEPSRLLDKAGTS